MFDEIDGVDEVYDIDYVDVVVKGERFYEVGKLLVYEVDETNEVEK